MVIPRKEWRLKGSADAHLFNLLNEEKDHNITMTLPKRVHLRDIIVKAFPALWCWENK